MIEGKKNDGEEVAIPMKEVQPVEQRTGAAKTMLFSKEGDAEALAGQEGEHSELHMNSTMQHMQLVLAMKDKEGERQKWVQV